LRDLVGRPRFSGRNGPDFDDVSESVLADLDVHLVSDVRDVSTSPLEPPPL